MRAADARLDELLGPGAVVFRASMELLADPVSVLWAVRDTASCIIDFEVVYANAAMARLFGVSIEDKCGRRLVQESPAFAREPVFDRMRGAVETGVPVLVESVVESRPGPIAPLSGVFLHRAVPFGPDAVMNLLTDITAQRRLESELEAFAQVAAHDVREPLMAIGLFVEQLASGLDRGRVERNEQLVELLRRTQARAKLLVDGILEYARYGRGADIDEVDMGVVVADVVSSLSATVAATKATIEVAELPTTRRRCASALPSRAEPAGKQPQVQVRGAAAREDRQRARGRVFAIHRRGQRRRVLRPSSATCVCDVQASGRRRRRELRYRARGMPKDHRDTRRSDHRGARHRGRHRHRL